MNRRMIAAIVIGAAQWARADGISVGYMSVPLQREYIQTNEGVFPPTQTQNEATFGPGTIQLLYTVERKAFNKIHMTLTTGVGLPIGTATFSLAQQHTNVPALSSNNAMDVSDTEEVSILTVPILVGANYLIPMGDNSLKIGFSVGAMLLGASVKTTDVAWAGPPSSQTTNGSTVTYTSTVAPAYGIFASVGYNIKTGDGESIGITVPIGTISEVRSAAIGKLPGVETVTTTPGATPVTTDDGWKAGGLTYAIQIGWSKSF